MITLNLKTNDGCKKLMIKEDAIFNAVLSQHPDMIKKLIKTIDPFYKIKDDEFLIINQFIDFMDNGVSIYPGLIVRTNSNEYAVLYLENAKVDEEYMVDIIKNFIIEDKTKEPDNITINRFEIDKDTFLYISQNN